MEKLTQIPDSDENIQEFSNRIYNLSYLFLIRNFDKLTLGYTALFKRLMIHHEGLDRVSNLLTSEVDDILRKSGLSVRKEDENKSDSNVLLSNNELTQTEFLEIQSRINNIIDNNRLIDLFPNNFTFPSMDLKEIVHISNNANSSKPFIFLDFLDTKNKKAVIGQIQNISYDPLSKFIQTSLEKLVLYNYKHFGYAGISKTISTAQDSFSINIDGQKYISDIIYKLISDPKILIDILIYDNSTIIDKESIISYITLSLESVSPNILGIESCMVSLIKYGFYEDFLSTLRVYMQTEYKPHFSFLMKAYEELISRDELRICDTITEYCGVQNQTISPVDFFLVHENYIIINLIKHKNMMLVKEIISLYLKAKVSNYSILTESFHKFLIRNKESLSKIPSLLSCIKFIDSENYEYLFENKNDDYLIKFDLILKYDSAFSQDNIIEKFLDFLLIRINKSKVSREDDTFISQFVMFMLKSKRFDMANHILKNIPIDMYLEKILSTLSYNIDEWFDDRLVKSEYQHR